MFSLRTCVKACSPCEVVGSFTTTWSDHWADSRASRIIPSVSCAVTSTDTCPGTRATISMIAEWRSRCFACATNEGLVVIPLTTPQEAASRISSIFAVSRKRRIQLDLGCGTRAGMQYQEVIEVGDAKSANND